METQAVRAQGIVDAMAREAVIHARNLALLAHPEFVEETLAGLEEEKRGGEAIPLEEALKQLGRR